MARSKKRAAPTAASERPAKKRASAAASLAKMKEIADAEEAFSEDEKEETKALVGVTNSPDEDVESVVDVSGMQDHEIAQDSLPVVAPGFRLWNTKSKLISMGEVSEISRYDETKDQYSQILKINHSEAFKLVPLVVTQGPYQGSHVFMLQPQSGFFRFMDFPAEIRNMIYECVLEFDGPVQMGTRKRVNEPKRPVPIGTFSNDGEFKSFRKGNDPQAAPVILRVSKQILQEAAPVLYGNNILRFYDLGDMRTFLERIEGMRPYIRHLHVNKDGWYRSRARNCFKNLKDVTSLRTLAFSHGDVCSDTDYPYNRFSTTPDRLVDALYGAFRLLLKAHQESESPINIADIIKIHWKKCIRCEAATTEFAADADCLGLPKRFYSSSCKVKCKEADEHCKAIESKIRKRVATSFGLKNVLATMTKAIKEGSQ